MHKHIILNALRTLREQKPLVVNITKVAFWQQGLNASR